jgi:hypothetical protein
MRIAVLLFVPAFLVGGVAAQATYDARIVDYEGLRYPCDGEGTPVLRILNTGSVFMNSCEIDIWKNGLQVNTFDWQLAVPLEPGGERTPVLPLIEDLEFGDELEFRILTVNGEDDEDPDGNIKTVLMDEVPVGANTYAFLVEVESGDDPAGIVWLIKSGSGVILASGGPYEDPDQIVQQLVLLDPDGCYAIEVERTLRNGSGQGTLRVVSGNATIITVDGEDILDGYERGLTTGNDETSPCTEEVVLELNTDLEGDQTTWAIADAQTLVVYCSGGPYVSGMEASITEYCCLPHGCYTLEVYDAAGDGMLTGANGGYELRMASDGRRIIDDQRNGGFGSISSITGNAYGFCLPMSDAAPIHTSCDKYWWRTGEYLVASPDDAVSAGWIEGAPGNQQSTTTGYEFWFFNPNGGYSFRRFRNHRTSDGFGPASAVRACHMKVNNWAVANHIPELALMNVRVRTRVEGQNGFWGPACRFVRNEALAQCPPTKLMDIPGNQFLSCGQFRQFGVPGQRVHARPLGGATQYQWRFRLPAESVEIIRTSNSYFLDLNWGPGIADPLEVGKTYEVDVRAYKNGSWCIDPLDTDSAWGDICLLTIQSAPAQQADQNALPAGTAGMAIWPNPNQGDVLYLSMGPLEGTSSDDPRDALLVEIFDVTGKRLFEQRSPAAAGDGPQVLLLQGALPAGAYLVRTTQGDVRHTGRMVVKP